MFETLKRLYQEGKINADKLQIAVVKGWISEAQKTEILS